MSNPSPNQLGFGLDLSCVQDLDPHMTVTQGNRLVAEAIARRLLTPKGGLIDDPNYGFDLVGAINSDISQADLGRIAAGINQEAQKDQRVFQANTQVTNVGTGPLLNLNITIALQTQQGPFTLVLTADQVTVSILSIGG